MAGTFGRSPGFAIAATIGMVLGAYYLLLMLQRVVFGPLHEPGDHGHSEPIRPIGMHEIAGLAPLMALIVLIGVYPKPLFDRISPAVAAIVRDGSMVPDRSTPNLALPNTATDRPGRLATLSQDRAR